MGIVEETLKNKEELIAKLLTIIEGKEAKAKLNLDGIEFKAGKTAVKIDGKIELTVIPFTEKSK